MGSGLEESRANNQRVSGRDLASNANNSRSYNFGSMHKYEYVKLKKYLDSRASMLVTQWEAFAWLEKSI